ncbi:MAG: lipocalin family protein [Chitinophagales bacterium]
MKYYFGIILMSVVILFTISCSKENKLEKNLTGTWDVINIDSVYLDNQWQFTFEECGKKETCNGSYFYELHSAYSDTSFTRTFTWELNNNMLTTTLSDNSDVHYTILEWEDDYMKWNLLPYPDDILELVRIK